MTTESPSMQVLQEKLDETLNQMKAAREAIRHLYTVSLDKSFVNLKRHAEAAGTADWYEAGDEDAPFFTEAYLYPMLGKEEARTVLAIVRQVGRALGMEARELH